MKKLLAAILAAALALNFQSKPPTPESTWDATYTCFHGFFRQGLRDWQAATALEVTLTHLKGDSLVLLRNTVNRHLRVLRITEAKGRRTTLTGYSLGYGYRDLRSGDEGTFALYFDEKGSVLSIGLFTRERDAVMSVYHPVYTKA